LSRCFFSQKNFTGFEIPVQVSTSYLKTWDPPAPLKYATMEGFFLVDPPGDFQGPEFILSPYRLRAVVPERFVICFQTTSGWTDSDATPAEWVAFFREIFGHLGPTLFRPPEFVSLKEKPPQRRFTPETVSLRSLTFFPSLYVFPDSECSSAIF